MSMVPASHPTFYEKVLITPQALVKMTQHALSGGDIEVMGLLLGAVDEIDGSGRFVVVDSVALPVQGTETRVNAGEEANEFMAKFAAMEAKLENAYRAIGWYHTHPGYRCWLSAIDVSTQKLYQAFQDPWIALVIDPHNTVANARVDIGAFRTFREPQPSLGQMRLEFQDEVGSSNKLIEFGASAKDYYSLPVEMMTMEFTSRLLKDLGPLIQWDFNGIPEDQDKFAASILQTIQTYKPLDLRPLLRRFKRCCEGLVEDLGGVRGRTCGNEQPPAVELVEAIAALEAAYDYSPSSIDVSKALYELDDNESY